MTTLEVKPRPTPEERADGWIEIEVDDDLAVFATIVEELTNT